MGEFVDLGLGRGNSLRRAGRRTAAAPELSGVPADGGVCADDFGECPPPQRMPLRRRGLGAPGDVAGNGGL
jgi:hypothetical protein